MLSSVKRVVHSAGASCGSPRRAQRRVQSVLAFGRLWLQPLFQQRHFIVVVLRIVAANSARFRLRRTVLHRGHAALLLCSSVQYACPHGDSLRTLQHLSPASPRNALHLFHCSAVPTPTASPWDAARIMHPRSQPRDVAFLGAPHRTLAKRPFVTCIVSLPAFPAIPASQGPHGNAFSACLQSQTQGAWVPLTSRVRPVWLVARTADRRRITAGMPPLGELIRGVTYGIAVGDCRGTRADTDHGGKQASQALDVCVCACVCGVLCAMQETPTQMITHEARGPFPRRIAVLSLAPFQQNGLELLHPIALCAFAYSFASPRRRVRPRESLGNPCLAVHRPRAQPESGGENQTAQSPTRRFFANCPRRAHVPRSTCSRSH